MIITRRNKFGGGWKYKLGWQCDKTFKIHIISLLFWEFRIDFYKINIQW